MKTGEHHRQEVPRARSADEVTAAASRWVERRRHGLDAAGERELAQWRAAHPAHEEAFSRLAAMAEVFQRVRQQGQSPAIVAQLEVQATRRRRRRRRRLAYAATVVAALLSVGTWYYRADRGISESIIVAQSPASLQRLPDGSTVELNTEADLAVRFEAEIRRVELVRGEALFRVAKDPDRPFVVRVAGVDVRAVGTAFNVRYEDSAVEIIVTEGKVGVDDVARGNSLLPGLSSGEVSTLGAGQKVVVGVARPAVPVPVVQVEQMEPAELKQRLAWRAPRFELDGVELALAVRRMNQENFTQIELAEASLARLRISGTFLADDPATFARLIASTFGLEAQPDGAEKIILRRGP